VGTILAFYYSKDNFDAASKSTQDLVDKITGTKLDSIPAREAMMGISEVKTLRLEEGKSYLLKELITNEDYLKTYNRLPVLKADMTPKYIVYRSIVDKFIASKAMNNEETSTLSLDSMVQDPIFSKYLRAFIPVQPDDSLSLVKALMDRTVIDKDENKDVYVADAFVTQKGTLDSPVIGWITNVGINKFSKV
jgi:hypothetical protein